MGVVFVAHDLQTEQRVAIKVLRPDQARQRERFRREVRLLQELSHPGIVRYLAHGETDNGEPYLALEWLDGRSLAEALQSGSMPVADAVALCHRAADALGMAHSRGVLHRDIKPTNLLLQTSDPRSVKLLDFGIARELGDSTNLTATGALVGTWSYMSPEQAQAQRDLDPRSDVFSLGCVLFECLTGRRAFGGRRSTAVLARVLLEEPPLVEELRPEVGPELSRLVGRMLSKDRRERPADGAEVARALADLDKHSAEQGARAQQLTRRERRVISIVVCGAPATAAITVEVGARSSGSPSAPSTLRSTIERVGGRIDRLMDGTMVTVVPPGASTVDGVYAAASCALAVHQTHPDVAVAVATGLGVMSSSSPTGDVIDRGVELLAGNRRGRIAVDAKDVPLLAQGFVIDHDDLGPHLVSRRAQSLPIRTLLGRPTPFVGRRRELMTLRALVHESADESVARVALVTGRAGAGKSRLLHELIAVAGEEDVPPLVLVGRGDPSGEGAPFSLVADAVRRHAGIHDGTPLLIKQRRLRELVARSEAERGDGDTPTLFLGEMCRVPFSHRDATMLGAARKNPAAMGDSIRGAFESWLKAECAHRPVFVVLDDLHWGDLPSIRVIDSALRNLADRPLVVVASGRPEVDTRFPTLWSRRSVQRLELSPLTRRASERLVTHALGDDVGSDVKSQLVSTAEGNAFFLEELIQAAGAGSTELPTTVIGTVQARLDRAGPTARAVLRAASVFGRSFWRGGVRALLGDSVEEPDVDAALSHLSDAEIVIRSATSSFGDEPELAFRHALVRDTAYAMLTDQDRAAGHLIAAHWLQDRGESDPLVLARHFDRGARPDLAVVQLHGAAEQALRGGDYEVTRALVGRGLANTTDDALRGAMRLLDLEVLRATGRYADVFGEGKETLSLLTPGTNDWFLVQGQISHAAGVLERYDTIADVVAVAGRIAADGEAVDAQVECLCRSANELTKAGRYSDVAEVIERAQQIVDGPTPVGPSASAWLAWSRKPPWPRAAG